MTCYLVTIKWCHALSKLHTFLYVDSTLTPSNLLTALSAVKTSYMDWWGGFADCLQVPKSMEGGILETNDDTQRKTILLERWLREHPAPSWALVAEGLYAIGEHDVLAQVKRTYITGTVCCRTVTGCTNHNLTLCQPREHLATCFFYFNAYIL